MLRLPPARLRLLGIAITVAALAAIARLTLVPHPGDQEIVSRLPITCLVCGDVGGVDVTLNVLLFMPLGFGLALAGVRRSRAILAGSLLSLTIETTQYAFLAGRDASLSDWLTNTTGTVLGCLLAGAIVTLLAPAERERRRLAALAAAAVVAIFAGTLWALRPSLPATTWWGQWQADLPGFDLFRGRVLSIVLDGVALPHYRIAGSAETRARMLGGRTELDVRAIAGEPTYGVGLLASVFDADQRKITLLAQHRRALEYELRTHAEEIRLRPITVRLDGAFPARAGDTVVVSGTFDRQRVTLRSAVAGRVRAETVTPNVSTGWALFLPRRHALGPELPLVDALWMAALLFPVGYWGWSARRAARMLAAAAAAPAAALLVLPPLFGFPLASGAAWVGLAAGMATGAAVARLVRGENDDGLRGMRSPSERAAGVADQPA